MKKAHDNNGISQFREQILSFMLPSELMDSINKRIEKIGYPVIVRSSSTLEDTGKSSMAGMFLSVPGIENQTQLARAVLEVWASAYYNCFEKNLPIGIVVQKYFSSELGGVVFSKHQLRKDCFYGEYSLSGAENVVDGKENGAFEITESSELIGDERCIAKYAKHLAAAIIQIREYFHCQVDVEWLISGGQLYILQARQITRYIHKKKVTGFRIVDADDFDTLKKIDMSSFYNRYMKWFDKRAMLRNLCRKSNVDIPIVKYVFYNNENLDMDQIDLEFARADIIKIESNEKVRTKRKEDVENYLRDVADKTKDGISIVRLQEITPTEYCGNACMTEDGNIYIECMPGGFGGFLSGELDFSHYLVSVDGRILSRGILYYDYIWKMNDISKRFDKTRLDKAVPGSLSKGILADIIKMTVSLDKISENIKIEFEVAGNKAYFNDATLDHKGIYSKLVIDKVISAGDFFGKLKVMTEEELRELKEQLGGRSFIAESEFIRKSKKYLKERLKDESVREVLVAPYPDSCLSALVSYYEGFIFERGGLLSHLAIILREQNKPAVIHREISGYADGADVEVIRGKVNIY